MGERYSEKIKEFDSKILAVAHLLMEWVVLLSMESVYRLFGISKEKRTLRHAEIFLVSTTLLIILLIVLAQHFQWLGWVLILMGNVRILQIISLNLNTLLFDSSPVNSEIIQIKRARWHFVAIGFSFVDVVMIFAFFYQFFDRQYEILNQHASGYFHYLYYSVVTITTIGYGDIHPVAVMGKILVMYEAMVALLFLIFFVSGAVGRLQRHV